MGHEQKLVLEYRTPRLLSRARLPIMRAVLLGPVTGAMVGFAQAASAVILCRLNPKCYFYFHGSGIILFTLLVVGGTMAGIPYGAVMYSYERFARRRVCSGVVVPSLLLIACAAEVAVLLLHPSPSEWLYFMPQVGAVLFGLGLPTIAYRRAP